MASRRVLSSLVASVLASSSDAQLAFGFHDASEYARYQHNHASSQGGSNDESVGSESVVAAESGAGGWMTIAIVACLVALVVIALFIDRAKRAKTSTSGLSESCVVSTKANDTAYQQSAELANMAMQRSRAFTRHQLPSKLSAVDGRSISIRPGTNLHPTTAIPTTTSQPHLPRTPTMPPPSQRETRVGFRFAEQAPRFVTPDLLGGAPQTMAPSAPPAIQRPSEYSPAVPEHKSTRRMSMTSLLARHTEDLLASFKPSQPASPSTPPQPFTPHSPAESPGRSIEGSRDSVFPRSDGKSMVAM